MTFTVHFEHPSFWDLFEIHHDKLLPTMRLIAIRYLNRLTALVYIYIYVCVGGWEAGAAEEAVWWEAGDEGGAEEELRGHGGQTGPRRQAGVWSGWGKGSLGDHRHRTYERPIRPCLILSFCPLYHTLFHITILSLTLSHTSRISLISSYSLSESMKVCHTLWHTFILTDTVTFSHTIILYHTLS